jgi:N-acyl-D-amino-acid deacylase
MYDYVLKNVEIVDGTGRSPLTADIGIKDGRIATVGKIEDQDRQIIEGRGMAACPGFIDMHSHTDLQYFKPQPPDAKVRQGITTELLGQDGLGTAPVKEADVDTVAMLLGGLDGILPKEQWVWRSFNDYLESLERRGLPNNAAVLLSHGPVRIAAMGMGERDATDSELGAMKGLVREAMEDGGFGLSTGLIYPPCSYGNTEELIELNKEVAAKDGVFVVHLRDEGYYLLRSFEEVMKVSRESGAHLHVSHLQAYGRVHWPIMDEALEKADTFINEGGEVTWDRYPYLAGCTVLMAVLPPWTLSQGPAALIQNLKKPEYRARIHSDFEKDLDVWHNRQISVGWKNIIVSAVQLERNRWMEGKSCEAIAKELGMNPIDMVCDLLAEEELAVTMITFYGSDEVLEKILAHSHATVGSDGIYGGRPHPRLYGTYPRFIKMFVREKSMFTQPEAIRKVTSFPAQILGISDRGILREGNWADIVLFDPETIGDTSTYEEPESYPQGIQYVFVNGKLVVDQQNVTSSLPGRVLRK